MELSDDENERVLNNFDSDNDRGNRSDEAEEEPATGKENGDEEDEETKRRIDPSTSRKKIVRNPLPKLNAERLQGPKGIQTIEKSFEGFKFRGKGHEKSDLNTVMKRLEYWAHRLFPKYCFDDFIERMETLGTKKNIQVFLKKYRLGMVDTDYNQVAADGEEEDNVERGEEVIEAEPIDEFDKLIAEQIEKQREMDKSHDVQTPSQGNVLGSASTVKPSELSDEIKARIEANRKLALERKMARVKKLEEEKEKQKSEEARKEAQMAMIQAQIRQESLINNGTHFKELTNNTETNIQTSANGPSKNLKILSITNINPATSPYSRGTNHKTLSNTDDKATDFHKLPENDYGSGDPEMENRKRPRIENSLKDCSTDPRKSMVTQSNKPYALKLIKFDRPDKTESVQLNSKATEISCTEETTKGSQEQSDDSLPELVETMEVSVVTESPASPDKPQWNNSLREKPKRKVIEKEPEKLLTEEELLRAIDGAMEEIIGNSSIVL